MMHQMNQEMTNKDLLAWIDDFMVRLFLRLSMEHEVIHQDGRVETAAVGSR